ncbi:hypothetical protein CYMTET_52573 [Cymbomonas tetramitiformis]|uniref:Methyltransferase type 11 domain-containing protein n=1 Tax=Cymbomonas tetramitiformis TaxID=36881 RepID=A0AAE0BIS1_9CHLO|nr:hypothetical protein CYMTET_52573 [Cymbomonas tetramitiformis]
MNGLTAPLLPSYLHLRGEVISSRGYKLSGRPRPASGRPLGVRGNAQSKPQPARRPHDLVQFSPGESLPHRDLNSGIRLPQISPNQQGPQHTWPRRQLFLGTSLACVGCLHCQAEARAALRLSAVPPDQVAKWDTRRDNKMDELFAKGMSTGMRSYENAIAPRKAQLFSELLQGLPDGATVVEVGIGTFPNAPFYNSPGAPKSLEVIGIDPNDSMEAYAQEEAKRAAGIEEFRVYHGVAEALPVPTGAADAIVCTLTLCSVADPVRAVAEIRLGDTALAPERRETRGTGG